MDRWRHEKEGRMLRHRQGRGKASRQHAPAGSRPGSRRPGRAGRQWAPGPGHSTSQVWAATSRSV